MDNISCGLFDSPQLQRVPEKSHIFTSIFSPFAWAIGYWNFLCQDLNSPYALPLCRVTLTCCEFWRRALRRPWRALKLSPSLIAHPAEPWKRYLILVGVIPTDLPGGFSLSLALVRLATLDIRFLSNRISFGRWLRFFLLLPQSHVSA